MRAIVIQQYENKTLATIINVCGVSIVARRDPGKEARHE
jgi:hypothetical protein